MGGVVLLTISMDEYVIQSITLYDDTYKEGFTEPYSPNEHDQLQAFEALECICEEEDVVSSIGQIKKMEDETLSGLIGPKRLEVTLRQFGGGKEKKFVVVDLAPPSLHFKTYSFTGREWKVYQKKLESVVTTAWSSGHWLARIDAFLPGGAGSATDHFTPQNQPRAWAALERMFNKFKQSELQVLRNWEMDEEGDEDLDLVGYDEGFYGPAHRSQHWTNRIPYHYTPSPPQEAYFRVAGDEVGAVIHREQLKNWEGEGQPSPEQSLKDMLEAKESEKKDEAGETSPSSSTTSQTSDDCCSDCGGSGCPTTYCIEEFEAGGLGGIPIDGSYPIH